MNEEINGYFKNEKYRQDREPASIVVGLLIAVAIVLVLLALGQVFLGLN